MSVLDESSAEASDADGGLAESGALVGSLDYMSPEQLRREPLDGRSDVFSLAVMALEALMGRHPFRGRGLDETRARILAGDCGPIDLPDVDDAVRDVLQTSLATDRNRRHKHAAAALRDLQHSAAASAARLPNSIAVLAFTEISDTPWAGPAGADELRRHLATVPGLRVLPRKQTEVLIAKHSGDPTLVGLGAGCRWVLDGEIDRLRNNAWRLNARLRRVATHALVESYSVEAESLAGLAAELGKRIAGEIGLAGTTPGNLAASDLVARTLELVYRGSARGTLRDGLQLLEEAIALEPDNVQALSTFGQLACLNYSAIRDEAVIEVGHRRLERARELEPQNPHPHLWLGYYHGIRDAHLDGERSYARARELAPDDWQPHYFYAATVELMATDCLPVLFRRTRLGEPPPPDLHRWARLALDAFRISIRISEKNSFAFWGIGALYGELGWFEDAIAAFERAIELEPISPLPTGGVSAFLAEALRRLERFDDAKAAARSALEITETNDHMYRDLFRTVALLSLGRINLDLSEHNAARAFFEQARLLLGCIQRLL